MKLETLRKNNTSKIVICLAIISSLILIVTLVTSRAKYIKTQSVTIVDNEIKFTPYDFKIMAMYKQKEDCSDASSDACYTKMGDDERMPSTEYAINETLSYCATSVNGPKDNDARIYTNSDGEVVLGNLAKESKCYLYFESVKDVLMAYVKANNQGIATHFTDTNLDENGVYETTDDDGVSYYFRGNVENNYVKFGNMVNGDDIYWRIIRINGDGSIRMIYAGTSNTGVAPGKTDASTNITVEGKSTFKFNNSTDDNMYLGYQYKNGEVHGNVNMEGGVKSNAELVIEEWFSENLLDEFQLKNTKIDKNAGFCNDRTTYNFETNEPDASAGVGTTMTYYGARIRTEITHEPSLSCNKEDLFTYTESNKGTKSLTYPIGLITADEAVYAGTHWSGIETNYYLFNFAYCWTMSPYWYGGLTGIFGVFREGTLYYSDHNSTFCLRPVINLAANSLIHGTGTSNDPYTI